MAMVFRSAGPIVGDAEVGPAIAPPAGGELDMAVGRHGVDGIVDKVGDDLSQEKGISANLDLIRRLAQGELHLLGAGAGPRHAKGASYELIEVDWLNGVADARRGALRKSAEHRHRIIGCGGG